MWLVATTGTQLISTKLLDYISSLGRKTALTAFNDKLLYECRNCMIYYQ